jgi:predicted nucleotide-binding protein
MSENSRVFISYARPDAHIAQALAAQLNAIGVDYWIDYANLAIGEDWLQAITAGLKGADGVIIISSARSSQSDWVMREIRFAVANNVPLLPVVVDNYANLPSDLAHIQAVLIRTDSLEESVRDAACAIQNWLARKPASKVDEAFSNVFAQDLAEEVSKAGQSTTEDAKHSVFVVHGHDNDALKLVRDYLLEIGVTPIILKDNEEPDDSLLRRFLQVAEQATFAVVVMSPDDFGASLTAYQAPKGERMPSVTAHVRM